MSTSTNSNYSTILQFLYQELLISDNHDNTKENLLNYFQDSGCDNNQLDTFQTCFQKATLDTQAFTARGDDNESHHIAPAEFSQRLVKELTKKYKDTKDLSRRITQLEEFSNRDISSSATTQVPIQDALSLFSATRLSTLNLEAAMISIYDQSLRAHVKNGQGHVTDNRHNSAYDEQVLTLRKKLRDWKLVWDSEGMFKEIISGGLFPYIPLHKGLYGNPEVIFGTSETNVQGSMVTSGTIIGLRVSQKDFFHQKLLWDTYTALMELNSTFPSRLFPLPLDVFRDKQNNSSTFAFEYPLSVSSATSLQSKIKGRSALVPLRSCLYEDHESSRRVLAHALRHYPEVIEMWCSQFGQAYRVLQHFPHIQYQFQKKKMDNNSEGGVLELVNADVFVREDGSVVLGNAMVSVEEGGNDVTITPHHRNTDPLVSVISELLSECLSLSRAITVQLGHSSYLSGQGGEREVSEPDYMHKIDKQLNLSGANDEDNYSYVDKEGGDRHDDGLIEDASLPTSSVVYVADQCGLDIFPQLKENQRCVSVSSLSNFVLLIENAKSSGNETVSNRGSYGLSRGPNSGSHKHVLKRLLASKANVVVKMTAKDASIISVISANGEDIQSGKITTDANHNKITTVSSKTSADLTMRPKKGFHFRIKAKAPGIAYITIFQSTDSKTNVDRTYSKKAYESGDGMSSSVVYSLTLKICVIDYPISKSSKFCEIVALSESSFWTPLHTPLLQKDHNVKSTDRVNSSLYLNQVFTAQAFRQRLSDSSISKVQRQWTEIQQILLDNATRQISFSPDDKQNANIFKNANDLTTAEQHSEESSARVDPEDEYVVDQVLKNKLYDDMTPPRHAEDMMATQREGTFSGTGSSNNHHLRYPQNTYIRGSTGRTDGRSVRRPPGETGWR